MKADELVTKITNDLIAQIEAGAGEWHMPWNRLNRVPKSAVGRAYTGINFWILGCTAEDNGWTSHQWGTFNQWKNLGHFVQKDEKATWVYLLKPVPPSQKKLAADPDAKGFTMARTFAVFAREQTDAPPLEIATLTEHERHEAAETFFAAIGADVRYGGDRAFYAPVKDCIQVPLIGQFPERDHFYSTLAHEHTHWTGHHSRLDRNLRERFGSEGYAMEELVAELGAAFIGAQLELEQAARQDHAQYLSNWLSVLKTDPKALLNSMSNASKALDHLNKLVTPTKQEVAA